VRPLEAAHRLAGIGAPIGCEYTFDDVGHTPVLVCCGAHILGPHAPDCPWLAMPQIAAALKVATGMAAIVERERYRHAERVDDKVDGSGTYSWCDSCDDAWPCNWSRAVEQNRALVAALKGETP
jgi:hypothetical protein